MRMCEGALEGREAILRVVPCKSLAVELYGPTHSCDYNVTESFCRSGIIVALWGRASWLQRINDNLTGSSR